MIIQGDDPDFHSVYWYPPDKTELNAKAQTCCSCFRSICRGDDIAEFRRTRWPKNSLEILIYGWSAESVRVRSLYHCADCWALFLALTEIGAEPSPVDDLKGMVSDYMDTPPAIKIKPYTRRQQPEQGKRPADRQAKHTQTQLT